jgi:hypothetical protein
MFADEILNTAIHFGVEQKYLFDLNCELEEETITKYTTNRFLSCISYTLVFYNVTY